MRRKIYIFLICTLASCCIAGITAFACIYASWAKVLGFGPGFYATIATIF